MLSRKRVIGVIDHTWDDAHIYYARLAVGLCSKEHGYDIVAVKNVEMLPQTELAGVIYRRRSTTMTPELQHILDLEIPYVLLNSFTDEYPSVTSNFKSGTTEAVTHLKEIGRRNIACLAGPDNLFTAAQRLEAFHVAMERNGLELNSGHIIEADFGYDKARLHVLQLLKERSEVDAIVCCSDRAAMGAIHAAKQSGRRVPEDIAIVGCGNMPEIQQLSDHPLTTVSDPLFYIAYRAAEKLVRIIEGKEDRELVELVDTNLVKRQSTLGRGYVDSLMDAHFQKGPQALDYIFSVGSSLEPEMRTEMIEEFERLRASGEGTFEALKETFLKAISKGFDASLAHFLLMRLEPKLKEGDADADSRIADAILDISSNEATRYGIHSRAMEVEIDNMMRPLLERRNAVLTVKSLLDILLGLVSDLDCRFIGLFLLDSPVSDVSELGSAKGRYWKVDTGGVSEPVFLRHKDLSPYEGFRAGERGSLLIEQMDLDAESGTAAFVFIDIDTKFGPFSKGLKTSLESCLQQIRLFSSLEESRAELERQKLIAEHANNAKSEFLAVVSHELRTPLNCIMGMTELTLKTKLDEQQKSFLQLSFQASKDQLSLVNDILDFSKIESGGMELKSEPFYMPDAIKHICDVMRMRALDKGLNFELVQEGHIPSQVVGDEHCIHQILTNIVGNATKFTPSGKITLRIKLKSIEGDQAVVCFEVEDTGVGIPEDKLSTIFNAFEQVDSSNTRSNDGVGLGLAIVKRTLDIIGGSIDVRSVYGEGSCFMVDIPLTVVVDAQSDQDVLAGEDGSLEDLNQNRRILVVDDNESNLLVSKSILEMEGHEVIISYSGEEALRALDSQTFDLILMDIGMPEMNGHEVTKEIRRREAGKGRGDHVPILAVTAHVQEENKKACFESGMDGFVPKPISRDNLLNKIDEVCSAS